MPSNYLYNVEFSVDDVDVWHSDELKNFEDYPTIYRFEIQQPPIRIEINDEEFCDQVNCDRKVVKNVMFSLDEHQLKSDVGGRIVVVTLKCPGNELMIGSYQIESLGCHFDRLRKNFESQLQQPWKPVNAAKEPCSEIIKELVQLRNEQNETTGSIHYTLRLTCFGSSISKLQVDRFNDEESKAKVPVTSCLDQKASCQSGSGFDGSEYQEYSAEINGNELIVRVRKDSHRVTRVFDCDMDRNGNEVKGEKNVVSILGCDQQVDFKFPEKFSCCDCKPKLKSCHCGPDSVLTDFQRKTSCIGKSFKNSCALPVIRGNLKYPGRLDSGPIKFDLFNRINPRDATEKYIKKPAACESACNQADQQNIKRGIEGKCELPQGLQACRKNCSEPDTDVFVLKLGSKKSDKSGKKHDIELELRTPKGPDFEVKKFETREIQVDEKELQDNKKTAEKKVVAPLQKGLKAQPKAPRGFVSKK